MIKFNTYDNVTLVCEFGLWGGVLFAASSCPIVATSPNIGFKTFLNIRPKELSPVSNFTFLALFDHLPTLQMQSMSVCVCDFSPGSRV